MAIITTEYLVVVTHRGVDHFLAQKGPIPGSPTFSLSVDFKDAVRFPSPTSALLASEIAKLRFTGVVTRIDTLV